MARLHESELILNNDGSVYHLRVKPGQVANDIIVVGDPGRVSAVSKYFSHIEFEIQNREIITHTGFFNGRKLTVMSTGMGTDNIDIVLNELDALVNIDLDSREPKHGHTTLNIIRLGTSGALQPDISLNAFVMAEYALGLDGLLNFYSTRHPAFENEMAEDFEKQTFWPQTLPKPYIVKGSDYLMKRLGSGLLRGITATAPGFYGPQGRRLRLHLAIGDMNQRLESFHYQGHRITNFEMETSALYGLSALLGHNALTICVAIANRHKKEMNMEYKKAMDNLICMVLERLTT